MAVTQQSAQLQGKKDYRKKVQATVQAMDKKAVLMCKTYAPVHLKVSEICVLNTVRYF